MGSDLMMEALVVGQSTVGGFDGEVAVAAVPEFDAGGVIGDKVGQPRTLTDTPIRWDDGR